MERYGRLVFGGNNNGIGLGGYIAGGGYGPLSPVFGLAVDNVLEIKVPRHIRNEPRSEKTGLRGFRPELTQTGLYSHTRWLEA